MKKETQSASVWLPTTLDTRKLEQGMRQFEPKVINGKKQYPFEQYAASQGVVAFGQQGQLLVTDQYKWPQLLATWDMLKWQQEKDQEAFFQANPEERDKHEEGITSLKAEIKAILNGKVMNHACPQPSRR